MTYIINDESSSKACGKRFLIVATLVLVMAIIWLLHLNIALFLIINSWHIFLPNHVWNWINFVAAPKRFILPLALIIITLIGNPSQIKRVVLLIISFYLVFLILKLGIHEARPYAILPSNSFFLLLGHEDKVSKMYVSFPSGHTGIMVLFVFALIRVLAIENKFTQGLLILLPVIVAITRVATGWHWPVDVLSSGVIAYLLVEIFLCKTKCYRE